MLSLIQEELTPRSFARVPWCYQMKHVEIKMPLHFLSFPSVWVGNMQVSYFLLGKRLPNARKHILKNRILYDDPLFTRALAINNRLLSTYNSLFIKTFCNTVMIALESYLFTYYTLMNMFLLAYCCSKCIGKRLAHSVDSFKCGLTVRFKPSFIVLQHPNGFTISIQAHSSITANSTHELCILSSLILFFVCVGDRINDGFGTLEKP